MYVMNAHSCPLPFPRVSFLFLLKHLFFFLLSALANLANVLFCILKINNVWHTYERRFCPVPPPSFTVCTNKTDGGQACRRITLGNLSLCGNSLLNMWQGFLTPWAWDMGVREQGVGAGCKSSGCAKQLSKSRAGPFFFFFFHFPPFKSTLA